MITVCLMITTDLPSRTAMTLRAMRAVTDAGINTFTEKVLSVDLQPDSPVSGLKFLDAAAKDMGWRLVYGECTGRRAMLNNIQRGLEFVHGDNLFYCEDHVIVERVPVQPVLDVMFGDAGFGWICYNTHVHQENLFSIPNFVESPDRPQRFEFMNDRCNWCRVGEDEFMVKAPAIHDEYYLNFPVAIAPLNIFRGMMSYGMNHYHDVGIEIGFTRAWSDCCYEQYKRVAIYTKPGTIRMLPFDGFGRMHDRACMRFRNNDPTMLHPSVVPPRVDPEPG